MLVKLVREGLGRLIVLVSVLTCPKPMQRSPEAQKKVDEAASKLALYQFYACPFCVKTRRAIRRLNAPIELRDAQNDPIHRQTLLKEGGKIQVPCLRIEGEGETTWLYESSEIIAYLESRFGENAGKNPG
ncbi:MAG TPA: glutaredoxin [Gammaproteobacteria bacterium]|nr:glutaredoxin [Gammaproteobacteria bacterium]